MKHSFNILLISLLSLMIVHLSVGMTVMHCMRTCTVNVGLTADCCAKKNNTHHCCRGKNASQWNKRCMDIKHMKLSPTQYVHQVDFKCIPAFAGILPGRWLVLPFPIVYSLVKATYCNSTAIHSPPRAYLAIINILII